MNKFENVDVLASLQQIMQQNTAAFQNDFDIDKKILTQAAKSKMPRIRSIFGFPVPTERIVCGNGMYFCAERGSIIRSASTMSRPRSVYLPMPWCCPAWRAAR